MPNNALNRQEVTAIPEDPGNIERLQDVIDSIAYSQNGLLSEESVSLFLQRLEEEGEALLENITDVPTETATHPDYPISPELTNGYLYEAAPIPDPVASQIGRDFWERRFRHQESEEARPCVHTWTADTIVIRGDKINIGQEGNEITIAGKDFKKLCDDLGTIIKALDLEESKEVPTKTISKVKQKIKNSKVRRITIMKEKI